MNSYRCSTQGHADCGDCPKCHYCGATIRVEKPKEKAKE